ncbi:hypothetical protein, partial [Nocardioides lentus]
MAISLRTRRALSAALGLTTGAALVLAGPAATSAGAPLPGAVRAAPLPAAYSASADADSLRLQSTALGGGLTDVYVARSEAVTDSEATPRVRATSRAAALGLAGGSLDVDSVTATAPPPSDPDAVGLDGVVLGVATLGAVQGDVEADWAGDSQCVPATAGVRPLGESTTTLARTTLAGVPGLLSLGSVEASSTTSRTFLQDGAGAGSSVVSETTSTLGDINLLGVVTIGVADPVVLRATSDGTTGRTSFGNPTVRLTAPGVNEVLTPNGVARNLTINLAAVRATLAVRAFTPTNANVGPRASSTLPAVVSVDLTVRDLFGNVLTSLSLGVGRASVAATAPAGGVECPAPPPVDTDGDGLTDDEEAGLGTDPLDPDTDDGGVLDGAEVAAGTDPLDGTDDFPGPVDTDG